MQNTISECTTHQTLKQMGYSSRRPHRMPPLSAKNRKWKLQFAQTHKHWTIRRLENVAWSDESQFLLDPSCLVSTVQAGCGGEMVWGIYSWHTLDPLVPIEHNLNATAYLSIVSDHVHPFMTTVYPFSDGYFQYKAQSSNHLRLVSQSEFTLLEWPPHSPDLNPKEYLWDVVEREKSAATVCWYHVNMDQNLWGMFSNSLLNLCHEELRQFWRQKGVQPSTSKVYLIKWPVSVCVFQVL